MAEIAGHIAATRPDVVGLQEMLKFEILDGSLALVSGVDFLGLIEDAMAARGLPYATEVVQSATTSQLPLAFDPSVGVTRWLRFTDRVVVLRRTDVSVTDTDQGVYAATFTLGPVTLKRGWARVSVDHGGVPHHFVTTHLEIQALAPVQAAQASQLLGLVAGLEGVTIIGGDLNSDAAAGPGAPSYTPTYELMIANGFEDVWELAPRQDGDPGYTCCQAKDLRNRASELDERIDFVLVRSSEGPMQDLAPGGGHFRFDLVGEVPSDWTPSGLWPSDHAGLAASVRILPDAAW
jgi:endonuclease/exonuclease/phosphatase family metal-dependent hydrolase